MPHVNYKRGETSTIVFRREHGRLTHRTYSKAKSDSWKRWKAWINRLHRHQDREALRLRPEDPIVRKRRTRSLAWMLG